MYSDLVQIDRNSPVPLHIQLADALELCAREGRFREGERLPSIRALSSRAGTSPATAAAAYRELERRGTVRAVPRSGFLVAAAGGGRRPGPLPLHRIEPNLRVHPVAAFARAVADEASRDPFSGGYEDYRGSSFLRGTAAGLLRADGIAADPDSGMLVCDGAQHAISLAARAAGRNARVAVEDPCYPGARIAFRRSGAEVVAVPSGPEGPDQDALEALAKRGKIDLFYCCPTYGNPLGFSWPEEARDRVLRAAAVHGFAVIEDDYLGDLDYLDEGPRRLAARPGDARVVYVRTYSKCLLPAVRTAVVAADADAIDRLLAERTADDICGSSLLQRGLARFLEGGAYAAHAAVAKAFYAGIRAEARAAFSAAEKGGGIAFDDPPAGFCLMGTLPEGADSERFAAECRAEGVSVSAGGEFFGEREKGRRRFRVAFSALEAGQASVAAAALATAARRSRDDFFERSLL